MTLRWLNGVALALLLVLLGLESYTVIPVQERGVLLRLGEVIRIGLEPGVVWRLPLLDSVQRIDMRPRFSDLDTTEYADVNGDTMRVSAWVTWRIRDLPRYYMRTGADTARVTALMQPVLQDGLRRALAAAPWPALRGGLSVAQMEHIAQQANRQLSRELGIEIQALRLRRVTFAPAVEAVVLERMRLARDAQAAALRADALEQAAALQANAAREQQAVRDAAEAAATRLRQEGATAAAALLAREATPDPVLARYWRRLETWRQGFGKPGDILVLAEDSELAALREKLKLDKPAAARPAEAGHK